MRRGRRVSSEMKHSSALESGNTVVSRSCKRVISFHPSFPDLLSELPLCLPMVLVFSSSWGNSDGRIVTMGCRFQVNVCPAVTHCKAIQQVLYHRSLIPYQQLKLIKPETVPKQAKCTNRFLLPTQKWNTLPPSLVFQDTECNHGNSPGSNSF